MSQGLQRHCGGVGGASWLLEEIVGGPPSAEWWRPGRGRLLQEWAPGFGGE